MFNELKSPYYVRFSLNYFASICKLHNFAPALHKIMEGLCNSDKFITKIKPQK